MKILTPENTVFELNNLPDEVEDIRYCVMDVNDKDDPDFFFIPLVFMETFNSPSAKLSVGEFSIEMPIDWNILIGDRELGALEFVPITSINERNFTAIISNPLNGFMCEWGKVQIDNIFSDVKWFFPKLKFGHILAIPVEHTENPRCLYFIRDMNRIPDQLNSYDFY